MKRFLLVIAICAAVMISCGRTVVSIEGKVTDMNSGNPLAGVKILPFALDTLILTDSTGCFKLPPVPSRPGIIKFNAPNYEPLEVEFKPKPGETRVSLNVELELKPVEVLY